MTLQSPGLTSLGTGSRSPTAHSCWKAAFGTANSIYQTQQLYIRGYRSPSPFPQSPDFSVPP